MRRLGYLAILLLFSLLGCQASGKVPGTLEGLVIGVSDGDTVTLLEAGKTTRKIRLLGIDAPESGQPFGKVAKQALLDRVIQRRVKVLVQSTDRYDRAVGKLLLDGADINLELVRLGLAWHYKHYAGDQFPGDAALYARSEREARSARRGLWRDAQPREPWDWRQSHRRQGSAAVEDLPFDPPILGKPEEADAESIHTRDPLGHGG